MQSCGALCCDLLPRAELSIMYSYTHFTVYTFSRVEGSQRKLSIKVSLLVLVCNALGVF